MLSGLKIVDLTRILAGPYCSMILGDFGATILKIERPGLGDDTRRWGPPFVKEESTYFMSVNRNKLSVAVNFKTLEGQKIVQKLAAKSDILMENYLPGTLDKLNLGYKTISNINKRIIYCSLTGYGQTGPYRDKPGYDVIASAYGGLMHITGPKGGEPCKVGVAMTDLSTGLYASTAILASLHNLSKTGRGEHIDCNLLNVQVATLCHLGTSYLNTGLDTGRLGTEHGSIVPYQAFPTKDGFIVVGAGNDKQFQTLVRLLDLNEMADDARFLTNPLRVKNRDILIPELKSRFSQELTSYWMSKFEGCSFPYGPINNLSDVFSDPQVQHSGMIQEMIHPTAGKLKVPGPPVRYKNFSYSEATPPPIIGEHTDLVLSSHLGYTHEKIAELRQSGVIQ